MYTDIKYILSRYLQEKTMAAIPSGQLQQRKTKMAYPKKLFGRGAAKP